MQNLEEQYENLYDFIKNLVICKSKSFNISINDLKSLNSFNELLMIIPKNSKAYFTSLIEHFYTDIIEPTKDEFY